MYPRPPNHRVGRAWLAFLNPRDPRLPFELLSSWKIAIKLC